MVYDELIDDSSRTASTVPWLPPTPPAARSLSLSQCCLRALTSLALEQRLQYCLNGGRLGVVLEGSKSLVHLGGGFMEASRQSCPPEGGRDLVHLSHKPPGLGGVGAD